MPTLREAETPGITSDVDVDQQLLREFTAGNSLSNIPLPDNPLPNDALPNFPLPEGCPDGLVCEQLTSACVAKAAMVSAFELG